MTAKLNKKSYFHLSESRTDELISVYRDGLLHDTLPFWIRHSVDREYGGFIFNLDRDGTIIDTDKAMWIQSRFVWLLSTMYIEVEQNKEWLDLARHGMDFIDRYGYDLDGKMFFLVTRDGKPLRKRRYLSTEYFAVIACAAYGKASGNCSYIDSAYALYDFIKEYPGRADSIPPKVNPEVRPTKSIGPVMLELNTLQILRSCRDDGSCTRRIDELIDEIISDFFHDDTGWILETVGPRGEFIDHFDGRLVAPGHIIEVAWFILEEARVRGGDKYLIELGCRILDWAWDIGWDEEFGGILYYRDVTGRPSAEYWHDMKFWWPQNETIIATLLAYSLTENEKYIQHHTMIHDWAYAHFPDAEHGEWLGYLHRDGSVSNFLKGTIWKGPFHLPRMQLYCWKLLEKMKKYRKGT